MVTLANGKRRKSQLCGTVSENTKKTIISFFVERYETNFFSFYLSLLFHCFKLFYFLFLWMYVAFYGASNFNQDIGKWNTGKVETMQYSKWNTKNNNFQFLFFSIFVFFWNAIVYRTNLVFLFYLSLYIILLNCCILFLLMFVAFYGASNFNQDIGKWNTGKVETMLSSKWNTKNNNFFLFYFFNLCFFGNAWTDFFFFLLPFSLMSFF